MPTIMMSTTNNVYHTHLHEKIKYVQKGIVWPMLSQNTISHSCTPRGPNDNYPFVWLSLGG